MTPKNGHAPYISGVTECDSLLGRHTLNGLKLIQLKYETYL
jgi:hypothetical protein